MSNVKQWKPAEDSAFSGVIEYHPLSFPEACRAKSKLNMQKFAVLAQQGVFADGNLPEGFDIFEMMAAGYEIFNPKISKVEILHKETKKTFKSLDELGEYTDSTALFIGLFLEMIGAKAISGN